jgi:hypothetical protein
MQMRQPCSGECHTLAGDGHEALLDALTDLEADPVMRGWLVEHVRLELDEMTP